MNDVELFVNFCDNMQINNNESLIIGEFSLEDEIVLEDDLVGYFSAGKNKKSNNRAESIIKLKVYGKERGIVPHFHVENEVGDNCENKIDYCFMLCENRPFNHTIYHNKPPKKREQFAKNLDMFMRTVRTGENYYDGITNWEFAIILWNENNPNFKIPKSFIPNEIPDYYNII